MRANPVPRRPRPAANPARRRCAASATQSSAQRAAPRAAAAARPPSAPAGPPAGPSSLPARPLPASERRADDAALLRSRAAADELEHFACDERERATGARALEEAHGAVEVRRLHDGVAEEVALDVRDRRRGEVLGGRGEL